jgi:hypothetical protein
MARDGGAPRPAPFDTMRGYLDLVERYSRLSRDPSASGVAAVITTADILRPRGHQVVIDTFEKMLADVKNDAVARAIRLQLVDLYRQSNQPEKALTLLADLIKSAPAGMSPAASEN